MPEGIGREAQRWLEVPVSRCYGCRKCSGGCPMSEEFDWAPHLVVRLAQLGREEALRGSRTLQLCTGCGTCGERCPNGIAAGGVVEALRRRFGEPGGAGTLHRGFLAQVRRRGRIHELGLATRFAWETRAGLDRAALGMALWRHGKLPLWPPRLGGPARREVAAMFRPRGGA
ncbi:MAG: 4Fe-4S dicluster domain-containing protein [Thermaerobacter sp.]|nr:4Fe-4S dicluster domain-containing protein [Thermaerobacter sp.]